MKYRETNPRKKSNVRKKNVRRGKKNKNSKVLAFIIVFLVICLLVAILSLTVFFKIENITVSGNLVYSADEIVDKSGVEKGENLFVITDKSLENKLTTRLPFVDSVKAKRILPGTLEICINEAVEKYCYKMNNEYYSVSENFKVLESYPQCPKGLILLNVNSIKELQKGKTLKFSNEEEEKIVYKLIEKLYSKNIDISRIDTTNILSIFVRVDNRFDVNFGSIIDIEKKIAHLEKMIEQIEQDKTGSINLSAWSPNKNESYFIQGNLQQ